MDNWNINKWIEQFKTIIEQKDLLYFYLLSAFILPFGLVYLYFYKEFPESIWILIFLTTISFSVFFFIYAGFFVLNKRLDIKIIQKIGTFLDSNLNKEIEGLRDDYIEFKEVIEKSHFNNFYMLIYSSIKDLNFSEIEDLKSKLKSAQETIENATILFKKFILIIFVSFIFSISLYLIVHILYQFLIPTNVFLFIYFLIFILVLFLLYLKRTPILIYLYFIDLITRFMISLGRRCIALVQKSIKKKSNNI